MRREEIPSWQSSWFMWSGKAGILEKGTTVFFFFGDEQGESFYNVRDFGMHILSIKD